MLMVRPLSFANRHRALLTYKQKYFDSRANLMRLATQRCLRLLGILAGASLVFGSDTLPAAGPNPDAVAFFETQIRPALSEHCFKCHGPDRSSGGLRLDSREAILKGGDRGTPALQP